MTTVHDSQEASPFPLTFSIPAGFHGVDLGQDPAVRAQRTRRSLLSAIPGLREEQIVGAVIAQEVAIQRLRIEGAVYFANFVGRSDRDPSAATTAQFVVSTKNGTPGVKRPLDAAAEAIRREAKPNRTIDFIDLPIGRCLAIFEDDTIKVPANFVDDGSHRTHRVRQIQVVYPMTDNGKLVFFALCTQFLRDWDDYVQLMASICKTIERREPERTNITSALDGLL